MIRQSASGVVYVLQGMKLLLKPGVRLYVILPLLTNFLLFSLFIWLGVDYFNSLMDNYIPELPEWLQWLQWLIWLLFIASFLLIGFYTCLLIANLIAAPFNGMLAEAVERYLLPGAAQPSAGWLATIKEIIPALLAEVRKTWYFCIRAVPLLILFVIPGLNVIAPVIWIIFSAWLLALEYADYPMSNHGILFDELRIKLKEKRLIALSFGSTVMLLTIIPVINFLAMPAAVAGATVMYIKEWKNNN
jgi:CysZ protein